MMAAITLAVSVIGYLEVRRLGEALYEIGAVRLPSIAGLEKINEAKTDLASSLDVLMTVDLPPENVAREQDRQQRAWERATAGWTLYEPLPQTEDEAIVWKQFVAAWTEWKAAYARLLELAALARSTKDRALLDQGREAHARMVGREYRKVAESLDRLIAINHRIVADAKAASIATHDDMTRTQRFMILAALGALAAGVLLAAGLGRRLSRPLAEASEVFSRIARGDFSARMKVSSQDEIGEMATAMNTMAVTLHDSETRFTEIFNHTTDALFFVRVTPEDRFEYEAFNPAAGRATGLTPGQVRDRDIESVLPAAVAEQVAGNYRRCIAAGGPIGYEEEIRFPPGPRVFNTLLIPVKDHTGRVTRIAGFARDVTDRRQAERTRQSLELRLRQAQKLEAIGQLAAGVAHDFNNILAALTLHLDILRTQPHLAPDIRAELEQLLDGVRRGANLTRQLRLFSRKAVIRREVVDLNTLFGGLLRMLRRLIGEHVRIELVTSPGEVLVHADPGMLEQIVMNLVVNARDAMPEGGRVVLTIDAVELGNPAPPNPRAKAGAYARLSVRDSGCGMSPEIVAKIFEPFFTTKGPDKGTGLGLPTVFGIADEHGGWVDVESEVDKGTNFSVFLPRHHGLVVPAGAPPPAPGRTGSGGSILVAEDDPNLRGAAALILRNHGYQVLEAGDERAAHAILMNPGLAVDLVLADLALPGGMLGRQLVAGLQHRPRRPKVVFMSGFTSAPPPLEDIGPYSYLPKPFDAAVLLHTVRDSLDQAPAGGPD